MQIWILRAYKVEEDKTIHLDYEKEMIYFSYEIVHAYALHVAWERECAGQAAKWCEIIEYENADDGIMEANWIYTPISASQMIRSPVVIEC
jgi:hypothetical protein